MTGFGQEKLLKSNNRTVKSFNPWNNNMYTKINNKIILIIWVVLFSILSYSFITETILSVFNKGQVLLGITGIIAFAILTGGVSIFAYGGYLLFMNTLILFYKNEQLLENIYALRDSDTSRETKKKIRKENLHFLIEAWKPSFIYFGLGVLLIVFGAILLNIADGTIHFR